MLKKFGKKYEDFYKLKDFKTWCDDMDKKGKKYTSKYYKGLGGWDQKDFDALFKDPLNVQYVPDKKWNESMGMVFNKKNIADKKAWIESYDDDTQLDPDYKIEKIDGRRFEIVTITKFIDNELITYCMYDNTRSIANIMDGLKTGQKKTLWVGLKQLSLTNSLTTFKFAANVADKSEYMHGPASLEGTIIKMAQEYPGVNNIAFLKGGGSVGTRLQNGKDNASSRYNSVLMQSITRFIFKKDDDPILQYVEHDGSFIEPKFYVPIIPTILLNGCRKGSIGSGYSSSIPCFNPEDLVNVLKEFLRVYPMGLDEDDDEDGSIIEMCNSLLPWYHGFTGKIERDPKDKKRFIYSGKIESKGKYYLINELPLKALSTEQYKQHLDYLRTGIKEGKITKTKTNSVRSSSNTTKSVYKSMNKTQCKEECIKRGIDVNSKMLKNEMVMLLSDSDKKKGNKAKTIVDGSFITKVDEYNDGNIVKFHVYSPREDLNVDTKELKLKSSEKTTNMTAFTHKGKLNKYADVYDIFREFFQVRFEYYEKRIKYFLNYWKNHNKELISKKNWISHVLENKNILKKTEEEWIEYFEKEDYYKKKTDTKGIYNYLFMNIRSFSKNNYEKLLKLIEETTETIKYYKTITVKELWTKELDEFLVEYKKYKEKRIQDQKE